jgi:hypothetical protein
MFEQTGARIEMQAKAAPAEREDTRSGADRSVVAEPPV